MSIPSEGAQENGAQHAGDAQENAGTPQGIGPLQKGRCRTPHLTEEQIKRAFCRALGLLLSDRERLIEDGRVVMAELTDTSALDAQIASLQDEMSSVSESIQNFVSLNAKTSLDQDSYNKEYRVLATRYESLTAELEILESDRAARLEKAENCWLFTGDRRGRRAGN